MVLSIFFIGQSCKKSVSSSSSNNGQDTSKPQPTALGIPTGASSSKVIGANGGAVVSSDGTVELDIPAGALVNDTTISIQPITNNCPGGINSAFRFTPNGLKFNQPATLKFHYPDSVLRTTLPELMGIAVQDSNGYWLATQKFNNDTSARIISTAINHFTDYSPLELISLHATNTSLKVNNSTNLALTLTLPKDKGATSIISTSDFYYFLDNAHPSIVWSANGIVNGDNSDGKITPNSVTNSVAKYSAPASPPSKNPVTISATLDATFSYNGKNFNKIIVSAQILVYDGGYHVALSFQADSVNESGAFWNITDSAYFDVLSSGTTSSGAIGNIKNQDATVVLAYNNGTCSVTPGPAASGPIHVLDSGVVAENPAVKNITIIFNNALNQNYYVLFPSWKYDCGSGNSGTLGGGYGPPFPAYIQFNEVDSTQTFVSGQYTIVVTPLK